MAIRYFQTLSVFVIVSTALVLPGCGGSGGGSSTSSPYHVIFERSPTGSQSGTDVFSMDGNGKNVTNLTNTAGFDGFPTVSQNGNIIAFDSTRSGVSKVYTMDKNGANQTAVSQDNAYSSRLSADGSKIVYVVGTTTGDIWIMNADGTGQTQLTNTADDEDNPTFTPDGNHIIFESNASGTYQLYSMDTSGNNVTRLTNSGTDDENACVSPDGTKVVFMRWNGTDDNLFVMDAAGGNEVQITNSTRDDIEPVYSPDGQEIFYSSGSGTNFAIRKVHPDGTSDAQVISGGSNYQPGVWQVLN